MNPERIIGGYRSLHGGHLGCLFLEGTLERRLFPISQTQRRLIRFVSDLPGILSPRCFVSSRRKSELPLLARLKMLVASG